MVELAALAVLTSDFARVPERRSAIVLAILVVALVTGVQVAVGLALFYAGVDTSLLSGWLSPLRPRALRHLCADLGGLLQRTAARKLLHLRFGPAVARRRWHPDVMATGWTGRVGTCGPVHVLARDHRVRARADPPRGSPPRYRSRSSRGRARRHPCGVRRGGPHLTRVYLNPSKPLATRVTVPLKQGENDRLQEARTSFDTFVDHPVLGSGPDSYPASFEGRPFRAHFTPLNVAATMGLPALAALIGLIAALWRARRRPTDVAIWSGLAGLGVDAIGQDVEHFRHVWIMLGLADADRREEGP